MVEPVRRTENYLNVWVWVSIVFLIPFDTELHTTINQGWVQFKFTSNRTEFNHFPSKKFENLLRKLPFKSIKRLEVGMERKPK